MTSSAAAQAPLADIGALDHARLDVARPWLVAAIFEFVPTVFAVLGLMMGALAAARSQGPSVTGASNVLPLVTGALTTALAALVGVFVMVRTSIPLPQYGFRAPRAVAAAVWFVPLALALVVVVPGLLGLAMRAGGEPWGQMVLAVATGVASVVWTAGAALAVLRQLGTRRAVLGAAALSAVLPVVTLLMQLGLNQDGALLVSGMVLTVLGLLVSTLVAAVTGSLVPGLVFVPVMGVLAAVGSHGAWAVPTRLAACVVLLAYAALLWRRLPAEAAAGRR